MAILFVLLVFLQIYVMDPTGQIEKRVYPYVPGSDAFETTCGVYQMTTSFIAEEVRLAWYHQELQTVFSTWEDMPAFKTCEELAQGDEWYQRMLLSPHVQALCQGIWLNLCGSNSPSQLEGDACRDDDWCLRYRLSFAESRGSNRRIDSCKTALEENYIDCSRRSDHPAFRMGFERYCPATCANHAATAGLPTGFGLVKTCTGVSEPIPCQGDDLLALSQSAPWVPLSCASTLTYTLEPASGSDEGGHSANDASGNTTSDYSNQPCVDDDMTIWQATEEAFETCCEFVEYLTNIGTDCLTFHDVVPEVCPNACEVSGCLGTCNGTKLQRKGGSRIREKTTAASLVAKLKLAVNGIEEKDVPRHRVVGQKQNYHGQVCHEGCHGDCDAAVSEFLSGVGHHIDTCSRASSYGMCDRFLQVTAACPVSCGNASACHAYPLCLGSCRHGAGGTSTADLITLADRFTKNLATVPEACTEECAVPCTSASYNVRQTEVDISSSLMPSLGRMDTSVIDVVKVWVFRTNSVIEVRVEVPSTSLGDLIGTIGGNLGLWCGISYMTVCEVLECCVVAMLAALYAIIHALYKVEQSVEHAVMARSTSHGNDSHSTTNLRADDNRKSPYFR